MKGIVSNDVAERSRDKAQRSVLFFEIMSEKVCSPFALNKLTVAASYWGMGSIPLRHAFASWRILSDRIKAAKHSLKSVLKFWLHGTVICILRDWRQFCIRESELRRTQLRISLRWKIFETTSILRKWQKFFRRERMRNLRTSVIASHTALSMQSRYTKQWKQYLLCSKYMQNIRSVASKSLRRLSRKRLQALLQYWTSRWYWKKVRLHACGQVEERRRRILKEDVLDIWLAYVHVMLSARSFSTSSQSPSNKSFPVIDEACAGLEGLLFGLKLHLEKALSLNQGWDEQELHEAKEKAEMNGNGETSRKLVIMSNHVDKVVDGVLVKHPGDGQQPKEGASSSDSKKQGKEVKGTVPKHEGAGHEDSFVTAEQWPGCVLKKTNQVEHEALQELMNNELRCFCPEYIGKTEEAGNELAILQDLTAGLKSPCLMDIKMGKRTFQESEVSNKKKRMDLLEKMIKAAPDEPTPAEVQEGITKLRYMQFRERLSSSGHFGFRLEMVKAGKNSISKDDTKTISYRSDIQISFHKFLNGRTKVWAGCLERLKLLRSMLEASEWFRVHELVGSSLLFVYDEEEEGKMGVWMIDFAHANKVPVKLDHRKEWEEGNHEDGYLYGLDSLIEIWQDLYNS
uniref:Kinase n=1 Tax=Hanusia phi TaxID=3032 RepID=A0A7S0ELU7_9CRYP|mmetsp:Transcript_26605/g.60691  ORF Transcript_26605/g.60691 Transcript_26605/m.60691 type:complete len:627 (+) Transcript_26605:243-2123(+)